MRHSQASLFVKTFAARNLPGTCLFDASFGATPLLRNNWRGTGSAKRNLSWALLPPCTQQLLFPRLFGMAHVNLLCSATNVLTHPSSASHAGLCFFDLAFFGMFTLAGLLFFALATHPFLQLELPSVCATLGITPGSGNLRPLVPMTARSNLHAATLSCPCFLLAFFNA